jgi:hypothetical protein
MQGVKALAQRLGKAEHDGAAEVRNPPAAERRRRRATPSPARRAATEDLRDERPATLAARSFDGTTLARVQGSVTLS